MRRVFLRIWFGWSSTWKATLNPRSLVTNRYFLTVSKQNTFDINYSNMIKPLALQHDTTKAFPHCCGDIAFKDKSNLLALQHFRHWECFLILQPTNIWCPLLLAEKLAEASLENIYDWLQESCSFRDEQKKNVPLFYSNHSCFKIFVWGMKKCSTDRQAKQYDHPVIYTTDQLVPILHILLHPCQIWSPVYSSKRDCFYCLKLTRMAKAF